MTDVVQKPLQTVQMLLRNVRARHAEALDAPGIRRRQGRLLLLLLLLILPLLIRGSSDGCARCCVLPFVRVDDTLISIVELPLCARDKLLLLLLLLASSRN